MNYLNSEIMPLIPKENYRRVRFISRWIWNTYKFLPYGEGPNHGRSTLESQLKEQDNIQIRDCKLPTYIAEKVFRYLGYDTNIFISEKGTHPFLTVDVEKYNHVQILISFHPEEVVCKWLTWSDGTMVRNDRSLASYAENNGYTLLPKDLAWKILDENYLNVEQKILEDYET